MQSVEKVLQKVYQGKRIGPEEGVALLQSGEFQNVGQAADYVRRQKCPDGVVSFLIDRNISYTNVCVARCTFCNFYRKPGAEGGYILSMESIFKKIEETLELGGTGILMQGGMHPDLKIDYYENLLSSIRERYPIHLPLFLAAGGGGPGPFEQNQHSRSDSPPQGGRSGFHPGRRC